MYVAPVYQFIAVELKYMLSGKSLLILRHCLKVDLYTTCSLSPQLTNPVKQYMAESAIMPQKHDTVMLCFA